MPRGGLLAIGSVAAMSCAHNTRSVDIRVEGFGQATQATRVRLEVPADWSPLTPSSERAEFLAPDRWSRVYLRGMPAKVDDSRCPALAKKYAAEFIDAWGGPPRTRVASKAASAEGVDFELRRTDPKPRGEVIWGRVLCRQGALAIASCTVPTGREVQLRRQCHEVLESLQVDRAP
jgi:hypothetical protein